MKLERVLSIGLALLLVGVGGLASARGQLARASAALPAGPVGSAITYQGRLERSGEPVSAGCDFEFGLYDAASLGSQVGITQTATITVTEGLFLAQPDFGAGAFDGQARWLAVRVMCPGDPAYASLGRQPLTAAPYALYAVEAPWSGLSGMPAGFADGVDDDTQYSAGTGLTQVGTSFRIVPSYRLPQGCSGDEIARWNGSAWACSADADSGGDITAVGAGAGLAGGGVSQAVTLTVDFAGSGTADTVARSDHDHSAADVVSGTLATDRFSAYADLGAEGYLGNEAGDLAQNNGSLQASLNADLLDGVQGATYERAYDEGAFWPSVSAPTHTITIPHWAPFTLQLASGWPHRYGLAFVQGFENDRYVGIVYVKYNGDGTSQVGGAECHEQDTTVLLSFGSDGKTYSLECPGEASGAHNLVLRVTGTSVELRYKLIY